jgi:hypothetical protein
MRSISTIPDDLDRFNVVNQLRHPHCDLVRLQLDRLPRLGGLVAPQ